MSDMMSSDRKHPAYMNFEESSVEVSNEFPISKEEMHKRAQEVLGVSKILEVEQRGNTLVMLFGNSNGNFVVRMTFFRSGEQGNADLCFKDRGPDESGAC